MMMQKRSSGDCFNAASGCYPGRMKRSAILAALVGCAAPSPPLRSTDEPNGAFAVATDPRPAAVKPDEQELDVRTNLELALLKDDVASFERLLSSHPEEVNASDEDGDTLLIKAGFDGALSCAKLLIERGAAIDKVNKRGDSAIGRAMEYGKWEVAAALLDHHPTLPPFALSVAARDGQDAIVDRLLAQGFSVRATVEGCNALHAVAKHGRAAMARKLVKLGAPVEAACDNDGFTPLMVAAQEANEEVVVALLELGARSDARDHHGRTALHWAAVGYRPGEVHVYRELGKPHDTVFTPPPPPLAMKALLDVKANIDALDEEGNTALHEAVLVEASTAVELLVARGAKRGLRNKEGKTALDLAVERGQPNLAALLRK